MVGHHAFMRTDMNGHDSETRLTGKDSFNTLKYVEGHRTVALLREAMRLVIKPLGKPIDAAVSKRLLMLLPEGCAISGNFEDDSGNELQPGRVALFLGTGILVLHEDASRLTYEAWELEWLDSTDNVVLRLKLPL